MQELWKGGPWEQPAPYLQPPPRVAVPQRPPELFRPRRKRRWLPFLALLVLISGLCIGTVVVRYLWPQEEDGENRPSITQSRSQSFDQLERAPTGTGVTLLISPSGEVTLTTPEIYKLCVPSIVSIQAMGGDGYSTGTGIVMTQDGYLLTNAHVVAGAREVEILFHDDTVLPAKLVGADADEDLAVLKVEAQDLSPAQFGDSDALEAGETVVAIGDPLGYRTSITEGIVSALDRVVDVDGVPMTLIQTSAPINFGNSGGALINDQGQVVGITTIKIVAEDGSADGLGFAIPMTNVKAIADWLIAGKPSLGMMVQMDPAHPEGLTVLSVHPNSNAGKAGIQPGDVILAFQNIPLPDIAALKSARSALRVGEETTVRFFRDGQEQELTFVVQTDGDFG